jgi:hypothetical protein
MPAERGLTETTALFSTETDMLMASLYLLTEPSDDINDRMSQFFRKYPLTKQVKLNSSVVLANKDSPGDPLGTSRKEKR